MDYQSQAKNAWNWDEETFNEAVNSVQDYEIDELIKYFKEKSKDGSFCFDINQKDENSGDTALHICARSGKYWQVKRLIEAGADAKVQNKDLDTPLHAVVRKIADGNEVNNLSDESG
jgi:ankyrin repeat protein